jgi:hypothetical protein
MQQYGSYPRYTFPRRQDFFKDSSVGEKGAGKLNLFPTNKFVGNRFVGKRKSFHSGFTLAFQRALVYISIMKKYKSIAAVLGLVMLSFIPIGAQKDKMVLFPEREYVKRHSEIFFKKVNLGFPPLSRVEFFVKSETYPSAYINLSETISKNEYLQKILPRFAEQNYSLIEIFNNQFKGNLTIETYPQTLKKLNISEVKFHLLIVHTIYNDYHKSRLSGDNAFKLWNILLKSTETAYKAKGNPVEKAAILSLSSHFVFFNKTEKWKKKARKLLKKIPLSSINDPDALLILGN